MMRRFLKLLPLCLLALLPANGVAQIAWDGPFLMPPRASESLGIYLMELHGGGVGVMGAWRSPGWNYGLRGGIGESGDGIGVFGGIDFAGPVHRANDEFPVDLDWVVGAGIGAGEGGGRVSVPLGLSAGHTFRAEGALITPWLTPRVMLDAVFGRDLPPESTEEESEVGLGIAVDVGLDLRLTTADAGFLRDITIRVGASMGDREAIAFGLVF